MLSNPLMRHPIARPGHLLRTIALAAIVLGAVLLVGPRGAGGQAPTPGEAPLATAAATAKNPKLASQLVQVAEGSAYAQVLGQGLSPENAPTPDVQALLDARLLRLDAEGRVQVFVTGWSGIAATAQVVAGHGGSVQRSNASSGIVQAWLPAIELQSLAGDPAIKYVDLPSYGVLQAGSVTTQGDSILQADAARGSYLLTGQGVKVGVISNDLSGLTASQSSLNLGPVDYTTCNVDGGNPTLPTPGTVPGEGTAMLEIVHDLAPGAELWFGYFGWGTVLDFNAAINCLAAHVDVVVDDVGGFNVGPYDGTSLMSMNTSNALNNDSNSVRAQITSVGNQADTHYQEPYLPCGTSPYQRFAATANTVDYLSYGPRCNQPITVAAHDQLVVFLQWNDPWGASCNDYDLHLAPHNSTTILTSSVNAQTCSQTPAEKLTWTNPSGSSVVVDLTIDLYSGSPRTLDVFVANGALNYLTASSSVPNQSDAGGGVISVGAINADDPGNDTIAEYSSRGPTNDGRVKPNITGIDGVSVSGSGGFGPAFYGTSAAAPHIAAIAALLLECAPSLLGGESGDNPAADRSTLSSALSTAAIDLGAPGFDNTYGSGLANAANAATTLCSTGILSGDVDCNGGVGILDAVLGTQYIAGLASPPCILIAGDVDCANGPTLVDFIDILIYVAGLPVSLPPGCPLVGTPT